MPLTMMVHLKKKKHQLNFLDYFGQALRGLLVFLIRGDLFEHRKCVDKASARTPRLSDLERYV